MLTARTHEPAQAVDSALRRSKRIKKRKANELVELQLYLKTMCASFYYFLLCY